MGFPKFRGTFDEGDIRVIWECIGPRVSHTRGIILGATTGRIIVFWVYVWGTLLWGNHPVGAGQHLNMSGKCGPC